MSCHNGILCISWEEEEEEKEEEEEEEEEEVSLAHFMIRGEGDRRSDLGSNGDVNSGEVN